MIYEILEADTPAELTEKVNERLAAGWRLQGGVSTVQQTGLGCTQPKWMQALIKD